MTQTAIPIREGDFSPFGRYYRLTEEQRAAGVDYESFMTEEPVVSRPLKFGITVCENGHTFPVDSMERHLSSEEIQFAGDGPIILSVADSDPAGNPRAEDVRSFLLEPGDLVVLRRGIWHDACHSLGERAMYYFLSLTNGDPAETAWLPVLPEPVTVEGRALRTVPVRPAGAEDCAPYGAWTRLTDLGRFAGDGWECWMTEAVCLEHPARVALCRAGASWTVEAMKRNEGSQTMLACGKGSMAVALARGDAPQSGEVEAFLLSPGEILVLNPGVWFSVCRGLRGPAEYYRLSLEQDRPEQFRPLEGGAVLLRRPEDGEP